MWVRAKLPDGSAGLFLERSRCNFLQWIVDSLSTNGKSEAARLRRGLARCFVGSPSSVAFLSGAYDVVTFLPTLGSLRRLILLFDSSALTAVANFATSTLYRAAARARFDPRARDCLGL